MGPGQPWDQILGVLRFPGTADEFLQALSARAEAAGQRALLLIDAINENNGPDLWPNHLAAFLTLIRRYPWIGAVLSIRTTAVRLLIPSYLLDLEPTDPLDRILGGTIRDPVLLQVRHTGFAQNPGEAVKAFFDYYRLPLPAAPWSLYEGIANPLLLRLYCQAAVREPRLLDTALPGLTGIVEAVLRDIDSRARMTLQTDPYGQIALPVSHALARAMLQEGRSYLTRPAATTVANATVPEAVGVGFARSPLAVLISEGLLAEDFIAGSGAGQFVPVVRFAFERIGDHLAAQTILDDMALQAGTPPDEALSRLSEILLPADTSATPGIAATYRLQAVLEAMAVLLPERLSRELPDLIALLQSRPGWQAETAASAPRAWLSSLALRTASAFSDSTRQQLADLVLGSPDVAAWPLSDIRRAAIATALALTVHPGQPLGSGWLHELLVALTMHERDRRWTAQIRGTHVRPSAYSALISWCRIAPSELLTAQAAGGQTFAQLASLALMWALPSPDRFLRDTATRTIVALADVDLSVIPCLLDGAAGVDDAYVTERVLAVVCAAVLRGKVQPPTVAVDLRHFVEQRGLPVHVLARDYLTVISRVLADRYGLTDEITRLSAAVLPPYPADWPGPLGLPVMSDLLKDHPAFNPEVDLDAEAAPAEREARRRLAVSGGYVEVTSSLGSMGDFYRYEMHGNNPSGFPFARQRLDEPLDGEPLEEFDVAVLPGWVFARVLQLGWSPAIFGEVDFEIREERASRDDSHKREWFGKKYQWLAWYEALARLSGTQRFCDDADSGVERPYESAWQLRYVRDIDPTHLLDEPVSDENEHWRALWTTAPLTLDATVVAVPPQDGPGLAESEEPPCARTWWFPAERLSTPILPTTEDPLEALAAWATDSTDLPDLRDYLVVRAGIEAWVADGRTGQPTTDGKRFRLLTLSESLLEHQDARDYPRLALPVSVMSILIARSDLPAFEQLPADGPGTRQSRCDCG